MVGLSPTSSPDDLSRAVSELENSRQALERRLRAESDAVEAEKGRAKGAEARFERLLAWARVQEDRRRKAEDGLRSACEGTQAAKARAAVLEEEVRAGTPRQSADCSRTFVVCFLHVYVRTDHRPLESFRCVECYS